MTTHFIHVVKSMLNGINRKRITAL